MSDMNKILRTAAAITVFASSAPLVFAHSSREADAIDGRWSASLSRDGAVIPFRLDISGAGVTLKGTLYDGFNPYEGTTSASYQDGKLVLNIEHYLTTISASLKDGKLVRTVVSQSRAQATEYAFEASRYAPSSSSPHDVPSIAGSWEIPLDTPSSKGEKAFRFIVKQQGAEVAASILRVDGDTGAYSGTYRDGKWILSHFDGSRPGVIVVAQNTDGSLNIVQHADRSEPSLKSGGNEAAKAYSDSATPDGRYAATLIAYRTEVARSKGLPEPEDYETHTTVRDPNERFTFNFRDVNGNWVSNEDALQRQSGAGDCYRHLVPELP
jgi:hypothetical protein